MGKIKYGAAGAEMKLINNILLSIFLPAHKITLVQCDNEKFKLYLN